MQNAVQSRAPVVGIGVISLVASIFLFWLVYFRSPTTHVEGLEFLPGLNALLNGMSAFCLVLGFAAIKRKDQMLHQRWMQAAFVFSTLFLISYIIHHTIHGDTKFVGDSIVKSVYLFVLISHIILSVVALPLVLLSFYWAWASQFTRHKSLVRYTFPIWLYVSVTGVLIFVMLKLFSQAS